MNKKRWRFILSLILIVLVIFEVIAIYSPKLLAKLPRVFKKQVFEEVYDTSGIERTTFPMGASWTDYNNDGFLDLLIAGRTRLYKNNGNETFTDVTRESGIGGIFTSVGIFGDYDNDGCPDLFLKISDNKSSSDKLFHNNCQGKFTDVSIQSGITGFVRMASTSSAAWADYDNNGFLDLYVTNFGGKLSTNEIPKITYQPNILYHNNGNGTFTDVIKKAGVSGLTNCVSPRFSVGRVKKSEGRPIKLSFQPIWFDFNDDGKIDLFITTDFGTSPLYQNNGDGTFKEVTKESGLCVHGSNMGITVGDFNNDQALDLYTTNVGANFLWKNNGNGKFSEVAKELEVSDPVSIGWGTGFLDYDNDGKQDIYVTNGVIAWSEASELDVGKVRLDKLYHNLGERFTEISQESGISGNYPKKEMAIGDFNNDGFEDILVLSELSNQQDKNRLYKNSGNQNNWLTIKLIGTKSNREGIGAKIRVTYNNQTQLKQVISGTSYLSQNSLWQTFGLGKTKQADEIEIKWPSGLLTKLKKVKVNQFLTIKE